MAVMAEKSAGDTTIRPFTIETPEADLDDLRARIAATQWPEKETVPDDWQGVPLAMPGAAGAVLQRDPSGLPLGEDLKTNQGGT
jgi:hypothetical protein